MKQNNNNCNTPINNIIYESVSCEDAMGRDIKNATNLGTSGIGIFWGKFNDMLGLKNLDVLDTSLAINYNVSTKAIEYGVQISATPGNSLSLNPDGLYASGGGAVTPAALSKVDDTNVTLTLGGTPLTALLQAVTLTLGWTGTLADSRITSAATWNAKLSYTTEVITDSLSTTQNDYAITGVTTSASVTTILRITPTVSFKFTGIDCTSWGNGKRLIIENVTDPLGSGARLIIIERESTGSSASNRFNYQSLNMPIFIVPGEKVEFEYNTTTSRLEILRQLEPIAFFTVYTECYTLPPLAGNTGGAGATVSSTSFLVGDTTYKPQGVLFCGTGTTATGRAFLSTGIATIMLGYGSNITLSRCGTAVLSTALEEYSWLSGLCDNNAAVLPTDAVAWQYDRLQSTDWTTITCSNNTPTRNTIVGFTPTINTLVYLGTFVNGDATNAEFFYSTNGEVWNFTPTPHTLNIPSGAARLTGAQCGAVKSAGLTSRGVNIDSFGYKQIMKRGA